MQSPYYPLGILINSVLPSWGIALGLVLFLSYMCRRTVSKAVTMFAKEKQQARTSTTQVLL